MSYPENTSSTPIHPEAQGESSTTQGTNPSFATPEIVAEFLLDTTAKTLENSNATFNQRKIALDRRQEMGHVLSIFDAAGEVGEEPKDFIARRIGSARNGIGSLDPKAMEVAAAFLDQDFSIYEQSPTFNVWHKRQAVKHAETEIGKKQAAEHAETARRQSKTKAARETIGNIFIDEIIEKSGVAVHTDIPPEYSDKGSHGFSTNVSEGLPDNSENYFGRHTSRVFDLPGQHNNADFYSKQGIHEGVAFVPVMTQQTEQVQVGGSKKLFSRSAPRTQARIIGEVPTRTSEIIPGASDEAAVRMVYETFGHHDYTDNSLRYDAMDGRAGNILKVSLILPESIARQLEKAGKQDPNVIRQVVEAAVTRKAGIPENAWRDGNEATRGHTMRPPHEAWAAKDGASKMYFKQPGSKEFNPADVVTFKGTA